jgi:hypothetical protein
MPPLRLVGIQRLRTMPPSQPRDFLVGWTYEVEISSTEESHGQEGGMPPAPVDWHSTRAGACPLPNLENP